MTKMTSVELEAKLCDLENMLDEAKLKKEELLESVVEADKNIRWHEMLIDCCEKLIKERG